MVNDTRNNLKNAHAEFAAAERKLEAARNASERARALLDEVTRQAEDRAAVEKRLSSSLADSMKAAIQAGAAPVFAADKELAKSAATRVELDSRRAVAVGIVEDLRSEERLAEQERADAQKAVEFAVKAVLKSEAVALADAWKPLDDAARAARAHLGRYHGPVHQLLTSSPAVESAISKNEKSEFDLAAIHDVEHAWNAFGAALLLDANAPLDFQQAEIAAAERAQEKANSEARIAAYLASVKATA